jgi:hypothetical protein
MGSEQISGEWNIIWRTDPPLAELVGIQFGMLAAKEIVRHYLTAFTLLMSQFEFECS